MALSFARLQYFIRIAEHGGLTRAAIALDVAQPALSRVLRDLELEFGCALFERTGRGLTLTDAGQRFLVGAREIMADLEATECAICAPVGDPLSHVTLGIEPFLSGALSPSVARQFIASQPRHLLRIVETAMPGTEGTVLGVVPDLCVGIAATAPAANVLCVDRLCLIGLPALLAGERRLVPLVLPPQPNAIRQRYEAGLCDGILIGRVQVETASLALTASLVESGRAVAIVPRLVVPSFAEGLEVLDLPGPLAQVEIAALVPPQSEESARSRLLMTALRAATPGPRLTSPARRPVLQ